MKTTQEFEVEKVLNRWTLTIGGTVIPFFFETKREAVAYAKRKVSGRDPEWRA